MLKLEKSNIKLLKYNNDIQNNILELKISGPNINYIIINTIRRTIFSDIPIYAFDEFKFNKNTSIFHNNYIKLRLQQLPIWGIENKVDYLENNENQINKDINEENEENEEIDFENNDNIKLNTLKQLTMYLNYKNKTNDIITVTTDDAKFYFNENQIKIPYPIPIEIIKLQPDQEISFSAISKIGLEKDHTIFSPVSVVYYKQINDNEFDFCLESKGQITEKRILLVAIINIKRKINNFLKLITEYINKNKIINNELEGNKIIINNEDHTLGNLISRGMQQHNDIAFAGYNMPHPLVNKIELHYKLKKGNIFNIIKDVCNYYLDLFDDLNSKILKNIN